MNVVESVGVAASAMFATYVINNSKLREHITDWFIERIGMGSVKYKTHPIHETIKQMMLESHLVELDNKLKEELYKYFIKCVLDTIKNIADSCLAKEKKLNLEATKKIIRSIVLDNLNNMRLQIDENIKMPDDLQDKFDRFRNYLTKQLINTIEHSLTSTSKKILLLQFLDSLEINTRWFFFYTTEMFENFNGHFNHLDRKDVFIKRKKESV